MSSGRAQPQVVTVEQAESRSPAAGEAVRDDFWNVVAPLVASPRDASRGPASHRLEQFLAAATARDALTAWLGRAPDRDREALVRRLNRDVALVDRLLNRQLNAILHQPEFQKLEASWRGLQYLVRRADEEGEPTVKIRVLNISWREIERDLERATEFDQSQLFRKVYEDEFGQPGGEPFGTMIVDHEIQPRPAAGYPHDDVSMLRWFSQIAAASFCPFVTSAHPAMFGLDDFRGLEIHLDHAGTMERPDYLKWRALRDSEDSRFLAVTLPRVLMRKPYEDDGTRIDRFPFTEDVTAPDGSGYLWGSAAYAFGGVLVRAFARSGWLADIRGVQRDIDGGGLVTDLPAQDCGTDAHGVALKFSTDVCVTDELERQLSEIGFLPLTTCQDTGWSAFHSAPSIQKPKRYDRQAATTNARLSAQLQHIFAVARFAHYLKVLGRDKVGAVQEAAELEEILKSWISRYVTADSDAPPATKARYPLREAQVQVRPRPGKPGAYQCVMHLVPHYELEELNASVRLTTELAPPRGL